jgi:NAD(P)-dependent dehydrogenase (short-subunit alcohol dehydrogenase family)
VSQRRTYYVLEADRSTYQYKLRRNDQACLKAMAARIPLDRLGLPEDTAAAVFFLCSRDAAYIMGESMNVSGGEEPH